jgi:hypothetical protein
MPKFVAVASTALCLCAIWSAAASAINVHVPSAGLTLSAAPPTLEDAALICRERCGYYGCRQFCVHRPGYGMYGPYGAYSPYGWYGYAREPWRDHEHEHEHWGRYEREREYEDED